MALIIFSICLTLLIAAPAATAPVDFARDVQPILQQHCYACHGADKQKSGLRLDIRSEAFKGGELYGEAIIPGEPADSPLIQFVRDDEGDLIMPPDAPPLSAEEVAILTRWVEEGAVWPEGVDTAELVDRTDHWSFKPVQSVAVPAVADPSWPRNEIDHFILARLEQAGLQPAPEAERTAWLRRVSFDITGLPPSPEQVESFINDRRDDAYERVVEQLLCSPRYGEHWGQHWLDVVRYADTHGFEVNTERPNAWPYRDYVIAAFNEDTPYDQFIREQMIGDLLGKDAATGFLVTASVLLPGQIGKDEPSIRLARQDALNEIVINIGQTFLGMSVGCARCHHHKFDPISHRDYYAMQAFVAGVEYEDRELITPEVTATANAQHVFAGRFRKPDEIRVLGRGNPELPQEEVAPAVLSVLGELALPQDAQEHVRRQTLANWIAAAENPLTARVMVNRIWQGHFGAGLVETANDFGRNGVSPSHPELLDWLSAEFVRTGWSLKQMHRRIVLSATYRQSTQMNDAGMAQDAAGRLLWRYPLRRLMGEMIRDSLLAASGQLNLKMGGPGFDLFDRRGGLTGFNPLESFNDEGLRRMIYAHKVRREREAVFGAFDCPDAGQSAPGRQESTTPIQALNLFNSRFVIEQAEALAARVRAEIGDGQADADKAMTQQIERVYQLVLSRRPSAEEMADAQAVVAEHGLPILSRVLFNCNEFLFIP